MGESLLADQKQRLVSLDAFRGITIAAMVLVNNPGSWGRMYPPLGHAPWDGWTPTDFVFPFFLFIVGVAMTFSFDRRRESGSDKIRLIAHAFRRSLILVLLGFFLGAFSGSKWWNMASYTMIIIGISLVYSHEPILSLGRSTRKKAKKIAGWSLLAAGVVLFIATLEQFGGQRIPGVLQRIAWCYFAATLIMLATTWKGRLVWTLLLLNLYWLIVRYLDAPAWHEMTTPDAPDGVPFPGRLHDFIDSIIFGKNLYRLRPDPEGLLSTLPAIATVLLGSLTGTWLKTSHAPRDKAIAMACAGGVLILAGLCMDSFFPINKKIWSSSYVVFAGGWAMVVLAFCYWLLDILHWRWWGWPFLVLGTNAILVFWASTMMAIAMSRHLRWTIDGKTIDLKTWLYQTFYTANFESAQFASLMWALSFVTLWVLLTWPFYRSKIFLKV